MTKKNGKMTLTFSDVTYSNLLVEVAPKPIDTEAECDRLLAIAESLTFKANKTLEERTIYQLLVMLIEAYENKTYSIPVSSGQEVLQHILEASGMRQSDLVGKLGSSGVVSEIVNGKRAIGKAQTKVLGEMFKVSPSLFI